MSALELVDTLKARGVTLTLEGGRIRYEPRSSVFDNDLERLRTYRAKVVKLLERPTLPAQDAPQTPCSGPPQRVRPEIWAGSSSLSKSKLTNRMKVGNRAFRDPFGPSKDHAVCT